MQRLRVLFAILLALSLTQMTVGRYTAHAADLNLLDNDDSVVSDVVPDVDLDVDVDLTDESGDLDADATVDAGADLDGAGDADVTVDAEAEANVDETLSDPVSTDGSGDKPMADVDQMPNTGSVGPAQPGKNPSDFTLLAALLLLILTGARALDPIRGSRDQ